MPWCMYVRWSTDDKSKSHQLNSGRLKNCQKLRVGKRFGVERFDSIEGIANRVCSSPGLETFAKGLQLYYQRFCVSIVKKKQFPSYKRVGKHDETVQG